MAREIAVAAFLTTLRQVVSDRYNGKPFFFWQGSKEELQTLLASEPELGAVAEWLNANTLAEDVIPRRAGEVLRRKLGERLAGAIDAGRRLLVVENPYLLLRYQPEAPFAQFWGSFVSSNRAAVVILPAAVARPAALPDYYQYRGDELAQHLAKAAGDAYLVAPYGGDAR